MFEAFHSGRYYSVFAGFKSIGKLLTLEVLGVVARLTRCNRRFDIWSEHVSKPIFCSHCFVWAQASQHAAYSRLGKGSMTNR